MTEAPAELDWLSARVRVLNRHGLRLARTSGAFHGLNSRMLRGGIRTEGSEALGVILYDSLGWQLIQVLGMIHGERRDDASLEAVIPVVRCEAVIDFLSERASKWYSHLSHDLETESSTRIRSHIVQAVRRYDKLKDERLDRLKKLRDKTFAHSTLGYDQQAKVFTRELWQATSTTLSIV